MFSQVASVLLGIATTFSQVTMFTWYCDYVFSGYYVYLVLCLRFLRLLCLLGIVTTFSQVTMFTW